MLLAAGLALPQLGLESATDVALALGLALTAVAFAQVLAAVTARRTAAVVLGTVALAGALVVLAWPEPTLLVTGRVAAWMLLGFGAVRLIAGHRSPPRAALGLAGVGLAFWAATTPPGSAALPVLWTALVVALSGLDELGVALWPRTGPTSHLGPTGK